MAGFSVALGGFRLTLTGRPFDVGFFTVLLDRHSKLVEVEENYVPERIEENVMNKPPRALRSSFVETDAH